MKKLIATVLITSLFSINICYASAIPQQFSPDVEAQLEQILVDAQVQEESKGIDSTIKAGENFAVELSEDFNSQKLSQGDEVSVKLLFPIEIDNQVVIPEGSVVQGKIVKLEQAGGWYKNAVADIEFTQIECQDDYKLPILAKIKTKDDSGLLIGASGFERFRKVFSALLKTSLGGAFVGFGIGLLTPYALAGAVVGCGVGVVATSGWLFFQKGQSIEIPSGTKLVITLQNDVAVSGFGI